MADYRIHSLVVAHSRGSKGIFTHMLDTDVTITTPVLIFLIEGEGRKILVDTGVMDPESIKGYNFFGGGAQATVEALARAGTTPEEIDTVILTHFHFDHVANIGLFPHARFVLQKEEWKYAKNPLPVQRGDYVPELLDELEHYDLLLVEDGYQVAPGITVICVPGHTLGQQAVIVDTAEGPYVIAGDLIYARFNLYPGMAEIVDFAGDTIPCTPRLDALYPTGNHMNMGDWYESVWRILAITGSRERVLPGHCPTIAGKVFPGR